MEAHPSDDDLEVGKYLVYDNITKGVYATFYVEDEAFKPEKFRFLPLKGFEDFYYDNWVDMTCATYNGKYVTPEEGWEEIALYWGSEIHIAEKSDNGNWNFEREIEWD